MSSDGLVTWLSASPKIFTGADHGVLALWRSEAHSAPALIQTASARLSLPTATRASLERPVWPVSTWTGGRGRPLSSRAANTRTPVMSRLR
jgi:hypothetical protein